MREINRDATGGGGRAQIGPVKQGEDVGSGTGICPGNRELRIRPFPATLQAGPREKLAPQQKGCA